MKNQLLKKAERTNALGFKFQLFKIPLHSNTNRIGKLK